MKKYKILILLSLINALLLTGCGGQNFKQNDISYSTKSAMETNLNNDIETSGMGFSNNDFDNEYKNTNNIDITNINTEKLVYTCSVNINTLHFNDTIKTIKENIQKHKGIIQNESVSDSSNNYYGKNLNSYINVRIPVNEYNSFLDGLNGDWKITNKSMDIQNITKTYYETDNRINSLKIQHQRLQELIKQANTIQDIIDIDNKLTEVENSINKETTELNRMDVDVAYSTVSISINEVSEYEQEGLIKQNSSFIERLVDTFKWSWNFLWKLLEELIFLIIKALPVLVVFSPLVYSLKKLIDFGNKKHKEKLNKKKPDNQKQ